MVNVTEVTVRQPPPRRRRKQRQVAVRTLNIANTQRAIRRRRRLRQSGLTQLSPGKQVATQWLQSLNDPFMHRAPKLGLGTMVPTSLGTAYVRQTLTSNADGSFAIVLAPYVGTTTNALIYNNGGASSVGWTNLSFANISPIINQFYEVRTLAAGLRAIPLVAATAVPGISYSGAFSSVSRTDAVSGVSPNYMSSTSGALHPSIGNTGAIALSRPADLSAFDFTNAALVGADNTVYSWSSPAIVFTGLPASTPIMVEAVLHFEGINRVQFSGSATPGNTEDLNTADVSNDFPSLEKMFHFIRDRLVPSSYARQSLEALEETAARAATRGLGLMANAAIGRTRGLARRLAATNNDGYFMIQDVD